jgi:hypothetical protein
VADEVGISCRPRCFRAQRACQLVEEYGFEVIRSKGLEGAAGKDICLSQMEDEVFMAVKPKEVAWQQLSDTMGALRKLGYLASLGGAKKGSRWRLTKRIPID